MGLHFAAHLALAGIAMRAPARRLGATDAGALLAGVAYAKSGYHVSQMDHVPYRTAVVVELPDGSARPMPLSFTDRADPDAHEVAAASADERPTATAGEPPARGRVPWRTSVVPAGTSGPAITVFRHATRSAWCRPFSRRKAPSSSSLSDDDWITAWSFSSALQSRGLVFVFAVVQSSMFRACSIARARESVSFLNHAE